MCGRQTRQFYSIINECKDSRHCRRVRPATAPEFLPRTLPDRSFLAGPARKEQPAPACLAGAGCFIVNSTLTYRRRVGPQRCQEEGEMTPRTSRISPYTESPHTILDHLAALTSSRISSGRLRIPCPAHGGTNPNLALWVNDDGIAARCHSASCSYVDIATAIETRYGISINRRRYHYSPIPVTTSRRQTSEPTPKAQDLRPYALRLWQHSVPIPNSPDHPTRLWLASRQLWRPELPLPGSVRWIGAEQHLHREFQGAGAVIAIAAPPAAWLTSWSGLPDLSSVQLVYVAADGTPAVDRGLTKRTYAPATDAVVVLGYPHLQDAPAPVDVAEGLADCLALAARSAAPAVSTLGTAGMSSSTVAGWLATSSATQVWADRDESKAGRAPPGQRHGRELVRMVNSAGGNVIALHTPFPHKDPAAAAAAIGFNDPDPAWPEYARTLAETTDWPRWEIARQAIAMCAEAE